MIDKTLTEATSTARLQNETMTQALHRLKLPNETLTQASARIKSEPVEVVIETPIVEMVETPIVVEETPIVETVETPEEVVVAEEETPKPKKRRTYKKRTQTKDK